MATQAPSNLRRSAGVDNAVIGGVGGYRQVNEAVAAGTNRPLMTPVRPLDTIEKLLDKTKFTLVVRQSFL